MKNFEPTKSKNSLPFIPSNNQELRTVLDHCHIIARRGKLKTRDEHLFEINYTENIHQIYRDIVRGEYEPSPGKAFITRNPVIREIVAAPYRDRVVHHLLFGMNGFWWDGQFIADSYSCRVGKGTLYGIKRMQRSMVLASQKYPGERVYVLMRDLSGFFMSIPRREVFRVVLAGLEKQYQSPQDKWKYDLCRRLWFEVVFDDPMEKVKISGKPSDWDELPKNKSLFNQPPEQGIVIGNLTSQLISNIYMNEFDQFMKFVLKFEFYGRYVDDFFVIVPESQLARTLDLLNGEATAKLADMGLKIHPHKQYCQPISRGALFLGQYVHLGYTTPGPRIRKNYERVAREFMMGMKDEATIISYLGMGRNSSQHKLNAQIFQELGWEYRW